MDLSFNEYCSGVPAAEAKHMADHCEFNRDCCCEASSPGGHPKCLFCPSISIPKDHKWYAETMAYIGSV